ncbi:MAG: hypothetical protein PHG81_10405 [Aliarcobacter sp.]|nr:hypothetical protein [Aliarcobacter sp.]
MERTSTNSSTYSAMSRLQTSKIKTIKTPKVITFIDKYNGFSYLSSTDEEIFREILSDDKLTMEKMQSLTYKQVKKVEDLILSNYTTGVCATEMPVVKIMDRKITSMLKAVRMTYNEDFNKALFKTVQTINNSIERMDFFYRLSNSLGFNDNTESIRAIIAKTNNSELKKKYLPQSDEWIIKDYKKFINTNINDLDNLLENPNILDEDKQLYQKLLNNFITLQKNHNKITNKLKHI